MSVAGRILAELEQFPVAVALDECKLFFELPDDTDHIKEYRRQLLAPSASGNVPHFAGDSSRHRNPDAKWNFVSVTVERSRAAIRAFEKRPETFPVEKVVTQMARKKTTRNARDKHDRRRRHRQARKTKSGRSSLKRPHIGPRSKNTRQHATYDRALRALALMRRGESLSSATRAEHIKPKTFLRYVGSAVRHDKPGGRFRVAAKDTLTRFLQVPTDKGTVAVAVRGIKAAQEFSAHANAIAHFNRTGGHVAVEAIQGANVHR
jgi:hypothetical protein